MKVPKGKTGKYRYYCDKCEKEISFQRKTIKQVCIKYPDKRAVKSFKLCDLCNKCYKKIFKEILEKDLQEKVRE